MNNGDPTQILLAIAISCIAGVAAGGFFVARGWRGICERSFPLMEGHDLRGVAAQLAASLMILLGVVAILSSLAVATFCLWRVNELAGGAA
ncbi:hypothetical protein [Blastopirellula marina]|uniref:Uncharacterized protein n=1 Tax=Blastopirellula marina TaxID=124 RepID=A0A2S8GT09_9BACT|nr:hypothetical protein [Blastopirellula marina]PQO47558.1 hypothetical protein C5Y93_02540 [Blastopirellula marina]